MTVSRTKSGKLLKVADAYQWMLECQKMQEKHGGFSQHHMAHMRGYQPFSMISRKLGYMNYFEGRFHWISDTVTMVMAELILHEHHIRNESEAKRKQAARRELEINGMTDSTVKAPIHIDSALLGRPKKKKKKKRGWFGWMFAPKPDADPFERFLEEVFRKGDNPFSLINQKLDVVNENQKELERKLIALSGALIEYLDQEDVA